jgi:hypothetical protein
MERPPAYQPVCRDEEDQILAELEEKDGISWDSNSTEIIPTNTRSFVAYLSILLLSLSANILLVMDNAKLRISRTPAANGFSKYLVSCIRYALTVSKADWLSIPTCHTMP